MYTCTLYTVYTQCTVDESLLFRVRCYFCFSSLPELLEKKKRIDMHTNIATALLDEIKERKLDTFFEAEEKMITRSTMVRGK